MPRYPKPIDLRANRERRRNPLLGPTSRIAQAPPPPAGLLIASRTSWAAYWTSPLARLVEPDTDLPALARLWTLYDEMARMSRVARAQRVVAGYRGQPRPNPLYRVMAGIEIAILSLEDRFGLSPRARLQLGIYATRSLADLNAEFDASLDLASLSRQGEHP